MALNVRLRTLMLSAALLLLTLPGGARAAELPPNTSHITGIEWEQTADAFLVAVKSDGPPTYTMYELFNPLRVVVDVADATLAGSIVLPLEINEGPVARVEGQMLDDQEPFITRIEILLSEDRGYAVERDQNDILIKFTEQPEEKAHLSRRAGENKESRPEPVPAKTPSAASAFLYDAELTALPSETRILLRADKAIEDFKKARLPKGSGRPDRLYLDIPNIRMAENIKYLKVGSALAQIRMAHRGSGLRVVFDSGLDHLFAYEIETVPEGLLITIPEEEPGMTLAALLDQSTEEQVSASETPGGIEPVIPPTLKKERKAPVAKAAEAVSGPSPVKPASLPDEFAFAGYNNQKITVDFFKIDLHNVFRLIGEISGRNIVVDEAVKGNLTLALNEVPWDFVLDVILNLKDLQKEERYNTIVISPKSKEFAWPKKAADKLAIRADGTIGTQEAITIKKRQETPPEVIEAKKLIFQAGEKYRDGEYEAALALYERAFQNWPDNKQLADRITTLALVQLGMNAKAVHYAKIALALAPQDHDAALHAAIALANMKKNDEAKKYFDLAISDSRPSSESLLSYAAFCEENGSSEAALTLLAKYEEVHGGSLDSMVGKARLHDKLGRTEEATQEYRAILLSGFELPADLKRYINGRVALGQP